LFSRCLKTYFEKSLHSGHSAYNGKKVKVACASLKSPIAHYSSSDSEEKSLFRKDIPRLISKHKLIINKRHT